MKGLSSLIGSSVSGFLAFLFGGDHDLPVRGIAQARHQGCGPCHSGHHHSCYHQGKRHQVINQVSNPSIWFSGGSINPLS